MKTDDLIGLLILGLFVFFLATERIWPARHFPRTPWWTLTGIAFFLLIMAMGALVPLALPVEWIAAHSLLPGYELGIPFGILVGYPCVALAAALVHRAMHHFHFLWRWLHQMHHSPQRVDIPGSVVFHPFDMLQNNLVSIAVTVFVLGLDPEAAAWTGFVAIFYGLFQHWNVRTPQWLGYIIQRPESHCVHHTRNLHAYNYSDFPLWDMLMGTFRNPAEFSGEAGFDDPASRRFGAMLIGRDVNPALDNGGGGQVA